MVSVGRTKEAGERLVHISMREGDSSINWANSVGDAALTTLVPLRKLSSPWALAFVASKLLSDGLSMRL